MNELSYQQKAIFQRLCDNDEKLAQLNHSMRSRASLLTAASTIIVGIITTARFLPNSVDSTSQEYILLSLVCLCSIGIYWVAALLWKGGITALTGPSNLDKLYDSYISQSIDVAYCNMLADLCSAFEQNKTDNTKMGGYLDIMVTIFTAQVALLALAIGWASLAAVF